MTDDLVGRIASRIGDGDMGPGISLFAVLKRGMADYYPDDPKKAAMCVMWALRRAAARSVDEIRNRDSDTRPKDGDAQQGSARE